MPSRNSIAQPVHFCFAWDELEGKLRFVCHGWRSMISSANDADVSQHH
jgi:hypothetical protein